MPFIPVENTAVAEIRMTWDLQQVENTLGFKFDIAPTFAQLATLGDQLIDWWGEFCTPLISDQVRLREVVVTSLDAESAPQATAVPATLMTGALESGSLPNGVSIAISLRTALRGRSFRGRNYAVGLTESQVLNNTVDSITTAGYQNAYEQLMNSPFSDESSLCVISRYSGVDPTTHLPIPRLTGIATPVTAIVITDDTIDAQRRRLPGRGR